MAIQHKDDVCQQVMPYCAKGFYMANAELYNGGGRLC